MLRFSTPTIEIETDTALSELSELWVSFKQGNAILRKTKNEIEIDGTNLKIRLTQEETAMFEADKRVEIQLRWLSANGSASGSNIEAVVFGRVLENEEITNENTD